MTSVGVELLDRRAVAVAVGESGRVLARAAADDFPERPSALGDLVRHVSPASATAIGVAASDPIRHREALASIGGAVGAGGGLPFWSGTAAALAEAWCGAAQGQENVVLFSAGEHTIAGILCGGRPFEGPNGRAPAAAWLALNPVDRDDYRKIGCLQAEVAPPGIVRRLVWRIKAGDESSVLDTVGGDLSAVRLEHVLAAARAGDGVSTSVMRDTAKYLGMAAANLVAIAGPEILVLGGLMASAGDLLFEPVLTELRRHLPASMTSNLLVVPAGLGAEDGPAVGAARLAALARR